AEWIAATLESRNAHRLQVVRWQRAGGNKRSLLVEGVKLHVRGALPFALLQQLEVVRLHKAMAEALGAFIPLFDMRMLATRRDAGDRATADAMGLMVIDRTVDRLGALDLRPQIIDFLERCIQLSL